MAGAVEGTVAEGAGDVGTVAAGAETAGGAVCGGAGLVSGAVVVAAGGAGVAAVDQRDWASAVEEKNDNGKTIVSP